MALSYNEPERHR